MTGSTASVGGGAVLRPVRLGPVAVPNRLGLGPVNPGFAALKAADRLDAVRRFYGQYAEADVGLVYFGGVAVRPEGRSNANSLVMTDPVDAAMIEAVADAVRGSGGTMAVQLMHAGRQASSIEIGAPLLAASPAACAVVGETPTEASAADIQAVVHDFGRSARAAARAGAQVIEVHAAHGYLISGFLSRASNWRTDAYGGSTYNRFRILRDLVHEVRTGTAGLCLGVRVNAAENTHEPGLDLPELVEGIAPLAGALDFISVSGGVYTRGEDWIIPPRRLGQALWRRQAAQLRAAFGLPVLLAGNIDSVDLAEELIAEGSADIALMVRSLLADPLLLEKWRNGTPDRIQPCTELLLCKYHSRGATNLYCPHNAVLRHGGLRPKIRKDARR